MSDFKFLTEYKRLSARQKDAVDSIDGPLMVLAGPGTGKTTVLTLRIANILRKTDTPPGAILSLTFTDSGVHAMREKLSRLIGPAAYQVPIHTFHSFGNDVIKTYPDRFPRTIGSEHMEEIEQIRIVRTVLDALKLKILRPKNNPSYYVRPIISAIKELKRENISSNTFGKLIMSPPARLRDFARLPARQVSPSVSRGRRIEEVRRVQKNKELSRVYAAYEKELAKRRLYDFEDMIMEVVHVLERDKDLLLRLQEEYQYILADEHQDANNAQNRLLELLSSFHKNPNLFIVGDEKQAIFRFQGASLENFLYFRRLYPKAKVIVLEENYRSHQKILDAAYSLIIQNRPENAEEAYRPLRTRVGHVPKNILIAEATDSASEQSFIAREIQREIRLGVNPRNVAVLIRENKDAEPVERYLRALGLPVARFSDADALSHIRIDSFIKFLEALIRPTNEKLAPVLFFDFLKLDPHDVYALLESARKSRRPIVFELRRAGLKRLSEKLAFLGKIGRNDPLVRSFNKIAEESGFVSHILSLSESHELLPLFEALLRAVERFAERNKLATIETFIGYLAEAREHGLSITAEGGVPDGVAVMTAHRAKGLEFDHVYILHANDGVWGGRRSRELFHLPISGGNENHEIEDERRLFYVALTRARKEATVSYYLLGDDGRERLPSRFLEEMDERHLEKKSVSEKPPHPRVSKTPAVLSDKKYLRSLFLERGFSVTHLNSFLTCPWRYFFVDLIRIPKSQTPALLYGSAIHNTLKVYFDAYARDEDLPIQKVLGFFESSLRRSHLNEKEFGAHLAEGKRELRGYLSNWDFPRTIWNEYRIAGMPFRVSESQEIKLNGSLDKVELFPDGTVNVVDYKTGRPKSRAEIEGRTKNSAGDYKRQLIFYRLLLDGIKKWCMKTGTIDFIKPDDRGRYRREVFEVSDSEVVELKKLIADVAGQILSLSFWNRTCDDPKCEWCRLRELLVPTSS